MLHISMYSFRFAEEGGAQEKNYTSNEFVKPRTATNKLSCLDFLTPEGDCGKFVATAQVFMSHAWSHLFLYIVWPARRGHGLCDDADLVAELRLGR